MQIYTIDFYCVHVRNIREKQYPSQRNVEPRDRLSLSLFSFSLSFFLSLFSFSLFLSPPMLYQEHQLPHRPLPLPPSVCGKTPANTDFVVRQRSFFVLCQGPGRVSVLVPPQIPSSPRIDLPVENFFPVCT